jgi:hypothetical protein
MRREANARGMTGKKRKELPSISIEGSSENEYELKDGKIVRRPPKRE